MGFMDKIIADSMPLWEDAANESFLKKMGENALDKKLFLDYIVQDSIYLRDYLKAFAMSIFKSRSLKEMQIFYSVLGFVNDSENATRLQYLADNNMTDADVETVSKKPACAAYTKFLIDTAVNEDVPEILMAVMPCMLGYYHVFKSVKERYPAVMNTYYAPLVKDYTSDYYLGCCQAWTKFCDDVLADMDDSRKKKLNAIFYEASKHELFFWQMAGGKL